MKHLSVVLFLALLPVSLLSQASSVIDGNWNGFIEKEGREISISLTFNTMAGQTDGSIDIPEQSSFNLPVEVSFITEDSLVFSYETGMGPAIFKASINNSTPVQISGLYQNSETHFPFILIKEDPERLTSFGKHAEQEHIIETGSHSIAGSLVTPESNKDSTLIILVSGSGSQTRNSPVAGFEIFKKLSMQLADQGYFTFRYDDRGTGDSTGDPDATLSELAGDLEEIAAYFTDGVQESTFNSVVYLGHSQGGVVSLLTAQDFAPRQIVLLSSPTLPGSEIIKQQIRFISEARDVSDEVVEQNLEFQERVYEAARSGAGWEELEQDIADRLREQINELPEAQQNTLGNMDQFIQAQVDRQLEGAKTRWFKSFIDTDPRPILADLQTPALALFAEKDTQVLADINQAELEKLDSNVTTITIEEANHLFQQSTTGMPGEYAMLDKKFIDGFVNEIIQFLDDHETE